MSDHAELRQALALAEQQRDTARKDCEGFAARFRDDGERMRALWGEIWRLGGCGVDAEGGGLAWQVMDRGGKEVAQLRADLAEMTAQRDDAVKRAQDAHRSGVIAELAAAKAQAMSGWAFCNESMTSAADWSRCWTFARTKGAAPSNRPSVYQDRSNGRFYARDFSGYACGSYETLEAAQQAAVDGYDVFRAKSRGKEA